MSKEPDILPEDHEQWERDYYDRHSSGGVLGCAFFTGLVVAALCYYIISLIF